MSQSTELSLEQEFSLRSFAEQAQRMSREQAIEFLIKLHKQMIIRENIYKSLLKFEWGIDSSPMPM